MSEAPVNTIFLMSACCSLILITIIIIAFTGRSHDDEDEELAIAHNDKQVSFNFGHASWFYDEARVNRGLDWLARQWKHDNRPQGDMLEVYYLILFLGAPAVSGSDEVLAYNAYVKAVTRAAEFWAYHSLMGSDKFTHNDLEALDYEHLAELQALKQGLMLLHRHLNKHHKRFNRLYVLQLMRELELLPHRPTDREVNSAFVNTISTAERILAEQSNTFA